MSEIRNYIQSHRDEMIELLRELVAVPSVQGDAAEGAPFGKEPARALRIMLEKCSELGFSVENVDNYAGSADFGQAPQLGILSHLDVVPEGTGWKGDPFVLREENGRLIGRGTCDDKGPAVAALFALRAVKELGIPLKKGVRLIFGTNEENGSADLAYYRTKRELPPMVFTPDGEYPVINAEKGMIRIRFSAPFAVGDVTHQQAHNLISVHGGTVINAVPESCDFYMSVPDVGSPSMITAKVPGRSAHASTPEKGDNAITKYLASIGKFVTDPPLDRLAQLFPHGETNGKSCGIALSDEVSGETTCVLSMLDTEGARLTGAIDVRFPISFTSAEVKAKICGKLNEAGFDIDSAECSEPHFTDENSPFVQTLLRVYEKVTGDHGRAIAIGGGTYVHDIPGGVAFGAEFPGHSGNMHAAEEFITIDDLLKNAEIMAEAIVELCS
ncbi:MAG: Sapep family Mn(2+)-dependent dipeptidase [Ruminococcus sp.]|nr:Sapep family Mn(2+)-dependent dipeptidase [Ruminococcus sp.]